MSNDNNNIDELFRGKLRDFSVDAPEHVWKGIEASRSPLHRAINYFKSKKGAALGSFILLATASGIAYFMGSSTEQLSQQSSTVQSIQRYNNTASIQTAKYNDAPVIQVANSNNALYPTVSEDVMVNEHAATFADSKEGNSSASKQTTREAESNATPNAVKETTKNSGAKKTTPPSTILTKEDNEPALTLKQDKENKELPIITKNDNDKPENKEDKTSKTDEVLTADVSTTKGDGIDKSDKSKGQKGTNIIPDEQYTGFTVDVYAGGNYTMRSLTNSGIDNNYFAAKRDAESYRPGIVLGARVNYDLKDVLRLRVGAQYTRFSQRLNLEREYQYTTIETKTGVVIDPVTQQPTGATFTRTDTVENTETARANTTNAISFIDIPVQFELDLYKKGKLSVFATAGAAVNLRFTQKGSQLNKRLTGLDEISSANNPFKTTAGLSILAGAGINYELTKRYSLLFETTYQHGISNVMKSNAGMNQSFRMLTGSVGLRYRF